MSIGSLLLLPALAFAAPVLEVPPGASAVTVLLCDRADGCPRETAALDAWAAAQGTALMRYDALSLDDPAGTAARARYRAAVERLEAQPDAEAAREAGDALDALAAPVPPSDLFALQLARAQALDASGLTAEADEALAAAVSCSGGRVTDLPALSPALLQRYYRLVEDFVVASAQPGTLHLAAADEVQVFVDGQRVGEGAVQVELLPGWHRVSAEATRPRLAWSTNLEVRPGADHRLAAELPPRTGIADLEPVLLGAAREPLPAGTDLEPLVAWAEARRLRWVHFMALYFAGGAPPAGLALIPDPDPEKGDWFVREVWLDVHHRRLLAPGKHPAALLTEARPQRFRVGLGVGYTQVLDRPGLNVDIETLLRVRRMLALELRVGLLRSAEPVYLYPGWSEHNLLPVAFGLRIGADGAGPYTSLQGLALVPYAVGGIGRVGWELTPTTYWRVGLEAGGGYTDQGWLATGGLRLARRY